MDTLWTIPNHFPQANPDEVHVWRVALEGIDALTNDLFAILSVDEEARARRFNRERDGARFATMRTALRDLAATYIKTDAAALSFVYNDYGKPDLDSQHLRFNVSHSGDLGLIAFHPDRLLGVDVERHRERLEAEKIARRYFSPAEVTALFSLPNSEQKAAFYRCWSRKEAYIKARGEGLAVGLDSFDVSLGPDDAPMLLNARGGQEEVQRWALHALPMEEGYAGALVVEQPEVDVRLFAYAGT